MTIMTKRWAPFCGTVALLAQVFVFQGCGGSNTGTAETGGTTGEGGSTPVGTGGVVDTGTGGTTATSTGGTTGTGGASGASGAAGASGGAAGAGAAGASGTFGSPACGSTAAGPSVAKGVACTAGDAQLCYKTCGPEKTGVKSETCSNGIYAEGSCMFDSSTDFSCYAVPATPDATCPTTAPMASAACSVPDCVVCGGATGYLDSSGNAKTGYCVCQSSASKPTWSCASNTAWPCPFGSGC